MIFINTLVPVKALVLQGGNMMRRNIALTHLPLVLFGLAFLADASHGKPASAAGEEQALLVLYSRSLAPSEQGPQSRALTLDGFFLETAKGRIALPAQLTAKPARMYFSQERSFGGSI
jgi:hypothetical protein